MSRTHIKTTIIVTLFVLSAILVGIVISPFVIRTYATTGALDIQIQPRDVKVHFGETEIFEANVYNGTAPYIYDWSYNGTHLGTEKIVKFGFTEQFGFTTPVSHIILQVTVFDANGNFGFDVIIVYDPVPSSGPYYLDIPFSSASYFIGTFSNDSIWMVNGSTWQCEETSTDASQIFNWVEGNCSDGESIFISSATYTFTSAWAIDTSLDIIGEGWSYDETTGVLSGTIIETTSDIDIISLDVASGKDRLSGLSIRNLAFNHSHATSTKSVIDTTFSTQTYILKDFTIESCFIKTTNAKGITVQSHDLFYMDKCQLHVGNTGLELITEQYSSGNIKLTRNLYVPTKDNVTVIKIGDTSGVSGTVNRLQAFCNHFWMSTARTGCTYINITKGDTGSTFSDFDFFENTFEMGKYALYLEGTSSALITRYCDIHSNYFKNSEDTVESGQTLVYLGVNTRANKVYDNEFLAKSDNGAVGIDDDNTNSAFPNEVKDNIFQAFTTSNAIQPSTETILRGNIGFVTENWGSSTGTGSEQTIAHGLAGTPTIVILSPPTSNANETTSADSTNIYVTADNGETWYWYVIYEP